MYKYYNGEIPKGCQIHHIDFNSFNNDISNLVALQKREHQQLHMREKFCKMKNMLKRAKEHLDRIRPLTKEWHASEDGSLAHRTW